VRYKGQTFILEPRYAAGKPDLMPEQAAELERSGVVFRQTLQETRSTARVARRG